MFAAGNVTLLMSCEKSAEKFVNRESNFGERLGENRLTAFQDQAGLKSFWVRIAINEKAVAF